MAHETKGTPPPADAPKPGAETPPADAPQKPKAEAKAEAKAKEGGKPKGPAPQKPKAEATEPVPPAVVRSSLFPKKTARAGLVDLVAVETCAAHGMMHFTGDRFSATNEVAERLLRRGIAKKAPAEG